MYITIVRHNKKFLILNSFASINRSVLGAIFSVYISTVERVKKFVLQSQIINNKIQTEKEMRKHGNVTDFCTCYYLWSIKQR